MIWELLVNILVLPLKLIFGVLPVITLPFFSDPSTTTATGIGDRLSVVNSFLPITEALTLAVLLLGAILPMAAAYNVANWIWRHIPEVWGFGTGAG